MLKETGIYFFAYRMEKNPQFLKQKYNLHTSPEVESAARRMGGVTGEKISEKPAERIQNYLNRLTDIFKREDPIHREQGVTAFKRFLYDTFVIKAEVVPESVFALEQKIARERGQGKKEISDDFKRQKTTEIISNQKQSLDKWIDYLASPDAQYPDWFKYVAMRSVLEMGKFKKEHDVNGKERGFFQKRTVDTVAVFPPRNARALSRTLDTLNAQLTEKTKTKKERQPLANLSTKLKPEEFQTLASTEDFNKIYTQFLIELPEYSTEGLQEIRGKWVKYERGADPKPLVDSLEGYPLEWCTAGYDTAKTQLEGGDFYTYYSRDKDGEDVIPRLAIRMDGDTIAEVRGIAPDQNLDPYIAPVVEEKMKEFGQEGEKYKKRTRDMEWLTAIEKKMNKREKLTRDDLVFLYEIEDVIEGFGYERDPRIAELLLSRNAEEDKFVIFDCSEEQIARSLHEINSETKAYIGSLEDGVFERLPENIEFVYRAFPGKRIYCEHLEVASAKLNDIFGKMKKKGINFYNDLKEELLNLEKNREKNINKNIRTVRLSAGDLGFFDRASFDDICHRAQSLGLEMYPAELVPDYVLEKHIFPSAQPIYLVWRK